MSNVVSDGKKAEAPDAGGPDSTLVAVQYTNDVPYRSGEEYSIEHPRLWPREANAEFRAAAAKSREKCREQPALQVITLRDITAGWTLLVDYGMRYSSE